MFFFQNRSTLLHRGQQFNAGQRNFVRAHAQIAYKEILVPKSTSPRLLAILAFDLIAGLCNRHLNSDRGYAYTNDL